MATRGRHCPYRGASCEEKACSRKCKLDKIQEDRQKPRPRALRKPSDPREWPLIERGEDGLPSRMHW